jgi:hypothetical protein
MAEFGARSKYKQEFASGKIGQNIRSYNTVLGHLGSLYDSLQNPDLPSSPIGLLEKAHRGYAKTFASGGASSKAMANEDSSINAVAGEMATIFKGTSGTDPEIDKWLNGYDKNAAREVKAEWVKRGLELVQSRSNAISYDYERSMGKPYNKSLISPKSQEVVDRLSGGKKAISQDFSEDDIQHTLKLHPEMTKEQLLIKLRGK